MMISLVFAGVLVKETSFLQIRKQNSRNAIETNLFHSTSSSTFSTSSQRELGFNFFRNETLLIFLTFMTLTITLFFSFLVGQALWVMMKQMELASYDCRVYLLCNMRIRTKPVALGTKKISWLWNPATFTLNTALLVYKYCFLVLSIPACGRVLLP